KNPMMGKPGSNPHAKDGEEEEEERAERRSRERGDAVREEEEEEEEETTLKAEDEEDEEEEERRRPQRIKQHGPSPHIPGRPTGKQGSKANPVTGSKGDTHQAGNAYDSPSDQSSEEEEETQHIKQDDEPVGVTP